MDLNQLEVFCKVYEQGSFSKAGEALCLTQPTISSHMKKLEDALQTRLFDRLGREIVPTKAGEHLYKYARDIVRLKEEASHTLEQLNGKLTGTLNIGGSTVPGEYLLPALIGKFRKLHGGVTINMRIGNSHDVVNMVADRTAEVGVIDAPTNNSTVECKDFDGDELILAAPSSFGPNRVSKDKLTGIPLILRERGSGTRATLERAIADIGISAADLNIVGEMGSTEAVKGAIMAGLGLSFISSITVKNELSARTLKKVAIPGFSISRRFYFVTHRLRDKGLLCQAFLEMLSSEK